MTEAVPGQISKGAQLSIQRFFLATMALAIVCGSARSDDLFRVVAVGQGTTVVVSGNSLPDILENVGDLSDQFAVLEGMPFVATVDYAGIPAAIQVRYEPGAGPDSQTIVVERLLGTDPSEIPVFDEANGDLGTQLEDYFLKNGATLIADFQKAIATESPVGVVSGNPVSAVGRLLGYRERRFGTGQMRFRNSESSLSARFRARELVFGDDELTQADDSLPQATSDGLSITSAVSATGGSISAAGFEGTTATIEPSFAVNLGDRASVVVGVPFGWTSWEGSNSWTLGVDLDIPLTLLHHESDRPAGSDEEPAGPDVRWTVVPGGGALGAFSYELIQGGLLWNAGILNAIEIYDDRHSISLTQQYIHLDSIRLEYDSYVVDYASSQDAIQLAARYALRLGEGCAVYAGTAWSRMLDGNAYVPEWFTPQAGVVWNFPDGGMISIGFEGQFGDNDWTSYGGQISIVIPF